jgi:predicted  nucleic acid-binding Zn-ribbon protein
MGNIKEKVAYLQGLTKGLNVSDHSSEGKLLLNMVDVLQDMAEEIDCLHSGQDDLENYVETIDEDLTDLEEEVYEDVDDIETVEVECPACHETVAFESDLLEEDDVVEVTCPNCGEVVYDNALDFADTEGEAEIVFRRSVHPGV